MGVSLSLEIPQHFYRSQIKIGTHDGRFHCDELLGTYMLKVLFPLARVVRTRNPAELATCDIVIDVGQEYDPQRFRFDHHQVNFDVTMHSLHPRMPYKVTLSSAGLVYGYFGPSIIKKLLESNHVSDSSHIPKIEAIFDRVYFQFIQEIDAADNGIDLCDQPPFIFRTNISRRVHYFNKSWNGYHFDPRCHWYHGDPSFLGAQKFVGEEFEKVVLETARVWWPARGFTQRAILDRFKVHPSGKIIKMERSCPWMDHVFSLEREMKISTPILYAISGGGNSWSIQGVPAHQGSHASRLPLPRAWRGLIGDQLSRVANIDGCVSVHDGGVYGKNRSQEGVLQMAVTSILLSETFNPESDVIHLSSDSEYESDQD